MINGVTDPGEYVYHYTKPATARDYILRDRTLLLGDYATTNDPQESKAWESGLVTCEDRDLGSYQHSKPDSSASASHNDVPDLANAARDGVHVHGH